MERKNSRYTIKLGELSREDIECIGAKAANLSELMRVGLREVVQYFSYEV